MRDLLTTILDVLRGGESLASATILTQEGSTPRTAGSKMLVGKHGLLAGSVGGGLLEGRSLEAAARALASGKAEILDFDLGGELAAGADMICGGKLRVFVEALTPADLTFFEALDAALGTAGLACATRLSDGVRRLVGNLPTAMPAAEPGSVPAVPPCAASASSSLVRNVSPDVIGCLGRAARGLQAPVVAECDGETWFVEPWPVPPRLILAGGGHVSLSTASVAVLAGFEVTVLDDRPEFASAARFPMAARVAVVPDFIDCFHGLPLDSNTFVVILTRGHVHDATVLEQVLAAPGPLAYIGMIGSARKRDAIYDALRRQGLGDPVLARVHCPVGLPIAAETPGEIAVSIVAECVACWRKKK